MLKVLIANDEVLSLEIMALLFESTSKCQVDQAQNGFEAFEYINKKFNNQPQQFYDLVVLDLNMPISDGYETCQKIIKLFNKNTMFSHNKSIILAEDEDEIPVTPVWKNKNGLSFQKLNLMQRQTPLLIACSSEIRSQTLEDKLLDVGFNYYIE